MDFKGSALKRRTFKILQPDCSNCEGLQDSSAVFSVNGCRCRMNLNCDYCDVRNITAKSEKRDSKLPI